MPLRVAVTGSAGKIGREACAALKAAGHRVIGLDLRAATIGGVRTAAVDCTDFGAVLGALSGIDTMFGMAPLPQVPDAVVHLAGIPAPGLADDARIFDVNTVSTYNVFSACARLGIKRIVWGSSETILGLPFTTPPAFVPVDESHPDLPNWSYSLAKFLGEQMADHMTRWHPALSVASLRFSNVFDAADYAQQPGAAARPDFRKFNLWGYVDARDAGEACRLAVEADFAGHERLIIAASDNITGHPSADLVAANFPQSPVKGTLDGDASLLSSARAKAVIGYEPRHSWRNAAA
ncbi:NAD-dependent epimerase/dehydratase family protein [Sphingomonas immobilis]|uniref:NAD(P)-dependent oxidoreductase n=1 Tax=Sphingomonas immobilis TaxID=3063997 RepID=A0ABT8ZXM6_9SPHN|nr:NAD(P)-dependent oxidoreductase [Sphingomonas sp. CA1-15]MDO7842304.1 NAD(P)-dependent oxidoreductase [Sphingomonas sp. CA1-15]